MEWIQIDAEDGTFGAGVERPVPAAGVAPVVVVVQEIFGVNADLRATCRELSGQGFIAIAPDLFWRTQPRIEMNKLDEEDWKRGFALYQAFDIDRGVRDIAATIGAARDLTGTSDRVGVTGYCLGGLLSFLTATRHVVDAAVAYYGGGTDKYVAEGVHLTSPTLLHLAEDDEYIPLQAQLRIASVLADNPLVEIHTYAGCNHAFARHQGAHYNAEAAALANARTAALFARTLLVPTPSR
jgi:carboxymethylenebutenolidase